MSRPTSEDLPGALRWHIAGTGELARAVAAALGAAARVEVLRADALAALLAADAPAATLGVVADAAALDGLGKSFWRPLEGPGAGRPAWVVAHADADLAVGADGWLPWPASRASIRAVLAAAQARARLSAERRRLFALLAGSAAPGTAAEATARLAGAPDATVWARGATAELRLAWSLALHRASTRSVGPFAALDAREIADGAPARVEAAWRAAEGGTLHVEAPSRLPADAQRVLARLAAAPGARSDDGLRPGVRLVAADGGEADGLDGAFAPELHYRLNVLCVPLDAAAEPALPASAPPDRLEDLERWQIERVLVACDGNRSEAARRLGLHRATLHAKLRRWR